MTARPVIVPGAMPSRDGNGRSLPAKLRFYTPGSAFTTTKPVYSDYTLATALSQPVLSDAAGRWPQMWADDAEMFDVAWSDQVYDEQIDTFTNLSPANDATLASAELADNSATAAASSASAAAASAAAAQTVATQLGDLNTAVTDAQASATSAADSATAAANSAAQAATWNPTGYVQQTSLDTQLANTLASAKAFAIAAALTF